MFCSIVQLISNSIILAKLLTDVPKTMYKFITYAALHVYRTKLPAWINHFNAK